MSKPPDPDDAATPTPFPGETSPRGSHLGYVAHEVRNPLSTALWTAELLTRLTDSDRGGPRGAKLAAICHRSVARIRTLFEDHILCERLDAGGYPVRAESLSLAEVLDRALARAAVEAPPVDRRVSQGLQVLADPGLLGRALDALVAAATKGTAQVQVSAVRSGAFVDLRVVGGPPEPLDDPQKGAPSEQRGRALALPTARRVAAALGGSLVVDGAGYLLRIPAA
jgi:signal transduction histidine kinase